MKFYRAGRLWSKNVKAKDRAAFADVVESDIRIKQGIEEPDTVETTSPRCKHHFIKGLDPRYLVCANGCGCVTDAA